MVKSVHSLKKVQCNLESVTNNEFKGKSDSLTLLSGFIDCVTVDKTQIYYPYFNDAYNSDTINELFSELNLNLNEKLNNCQSWINSQVAEIKAYEAKTKHYKELAEVEANKGKQLQKKVDYIVENMKTAVLLTKDKKIETDLFKFTVRKSESVAVADAETLPRAYIRLKREADKKLIKEALKRGEQIEGCSIVENYSLGVK